MKKTIPLIFLGLILIETVSAGFIAVNPYYVEQGNSINITLYPSTSGMNCIGTIRKEGTIDVLGFIHFECDSHCKCYSPVSTTFNISQGMFGNYYASVWDESIDDFSKGYFNVIKNSCSNWIKDGNESDVDCGGDKCNKCYTEKNCNVNSDCLSGYCNFENKCGENNSIKKREKYSEKEIFLVSDKNWKKVLKLVPLTTWNENSNIIKFPVLIYHNEDTENAPNEKNTTNGTGYNRYDADSSIHFINEYNPTHVTIFGESPKKLESLLVLDKTFGAGLNERQISKISFNNYYSYWDEIKEVVISKNDYETGLIASVFASYKNAPLIFEDEIDYGVIDKKKVYVVGDINKTVTNKIKKIVNKTKEYSLEELQKEYINLTNTDKVIIINSNDIKIKLDKSFRTKKSSKIKEIYSKNSLAAPFLAAQRYEIIIDIKIPESPENSNCQESKEILKNFNETKELIEDKIKNLFEEEPEYLTIIASPNSIPDSIYNGCHETGVQYRNSSDLVYANISNKILKVGRIYGITVSDTSSYIAREMFYDKIFNEMYGNEATGLSIGHSFERYSENSQKQHNASIKSSYYSLCYTGEKKEGCIKKIYVPLSEYSMKQFILFGDHGYPDEWADTLKSNKIPELGLSYIFAHACSTNNFWEGKEKLMSSNMIRQGAIAYHGAVGVSYADNSESIALQKLTSTNITLGKLNNELSEEFYNYKKDYLMLGDPVFQPKLRKINWTGVEFYNNSIIEIEAKSIDKGAAIIHVGSKKENYSPEENIVIKIKIKNEKNFSTEGYLEYNIFSTAGKYISELELQKISLKANSEKEINFSMEVIDTMPSGNYKIIVRLLNGEEEINKKEVLFNIQNTLKEFEITLKSCENINCVEEARVFEKNETIYLDYESNDSFNITSILRYPDLTEKEISLPYEFSSDFEGNYILSINAAREGYKTYDEDLIFGIKDINITMEESCNSNGICENNETEQNCPQDCNEVNISDENNSENENNNTEKNDDNKENENKVDYIIKEVADEEISDNHLEDYFYEQNYVSHIDNVKKINADGLSDLKLKITFSNLIFTLFIFIFILLVIVLLTVIRKT